MPAGAGSPPPFGSPRGGDGVLRALRHILGGLLLLLVATVAITAAATHLSSLAGLETLTIRGRSMEPAISLGAIVAVAPVAQVREGDVIAFRATNGVVVTHRVIGVVGVDGVDHLLTRGDANDNPDPNPVHPDSVIGRVEFQLPVLGYLAWMLSTAPGLIAVVTGFAALLMLLWLVEEVDTDRSARATLVLGRP